MSAIAEVVKLRLKFAGADTLLFKDVTVSIERGQKVLLLGPSGCGKSTLLQVLTGIIPGSIEVPVKFDSIRIPERPGYVFQDPDTQFCMPFVDEEMAFVLENLQVPRERMKTVMADLLGQVGLHFGDLHTPIQSLSQGMKQRLAIASVLALEPDTLFLDEPTALLDPEGTRHVWETIKQVGRDKTVVIVEHKIDEIVDFVDRILLFDDSGKLLADGTAGHIFAQWKRQLLEYGIWYPGVWDDYGNGEYYNAMMSERMDENADSRSKLLQLSGFAGYYGKRKRIEVDALQVEAGEWIALVGENGAGKSTLLQSLMQLIRTTGDYRAAGKQVRKFEDAAGVLAYVFQNPEFQFVTHSVYEEVAVTIRKHSRAAASPGPEAELQIAAQTRELLGRFGLAGLEARHPYQLSLGQKRRLSVATAVLDERAVLLLDEPTFGQDARNTFAILELLERLRRQGTAILMVTHDPDIVSRFATRVWVVDQGRLVADELPADYMTRRQPADGDEAETAANEERGETRHAAIRV